VLSPTGVATLYRGESPISTFASDGVADAEVARGAAGPSAPQPTKTASDKASSTSGMNEARTMNGLLKSRERAGRTKPRPVVAASQPGRANLRGDE
jgi:hypothetical protein